MTVAEWLNAIWRRQPMNQLPQPPEHLDTLQMQANGWIERGADGWRVHPICARLFGWRRDTN